MQINDKVKISSIIFFVIVLGMIVVTSISVDNKEENSIKFIQLDGNIHLPTDEYYRFANIEDETLYENLTSAIIKDRLEKHPYVQRVDAILNENTLSITIYEKKFESLLMYGNNECLVTEDNIKIPKLPLSEKIDYPIISNPLGANEMGEFENILSNSDITTGLKMISTLKLINPDLYENISEIDLREGRDIVIQFSQFNFPIVIGRKREIEKIMYLEQLVQSLDNKFLRDGIEYIDLRYSEHIYIGRSVDNNDDTRGSNS
ncbi:MAG: cell division protein FtsQ/DivIB [Bacteroidota bacterium]